MGEDKELEKRAIEELLRETDRARVRAETMGPAGWLKCPLQTTNKRFLINTLRSSGLHQHIADPRDRNSSTRGRLRSDSPDRSRDRSRTPPRYHRGSGGHSEHKHHHHHHHRDSSDNKDNKQDGDRDRSHRHKHNRDQRHERDGHKRDKDRIIHE